MEQARAFRWSEIPKFFAEIVAALASFVLWFGTAGRAAHYLGWEPLTEQSHGLEVSAIAGLIFMLMLAEFVVALVGYQLLRLFHPRLRALLFFNLGLALLALMTVPLLFAID